MARIRYITFNENANRHDVLNVSKTGLITTRDHCGNSIMQMDAIEDDELVDRVQFPIKVKDIQTV